MNWTSWADFVAMGGYGAYVWGAFGVTAAALAGELLALRSRGRALRDSLAPSPRSAGPAATRPAYRAEHRAEHRIEYREGAA